MIYKDFITIEGIDGSAKTTQSLRLAKFIRENYQSCFLTEEPTKGGPIGKFTRDRILTGDIQVEPMAVQLLIAADRSYHIHNKSGSGMLEHLQRGNVIVSDRNYMSAFGLGGSAGLSFEEMYNINERNINDMMPGLTIFIDVKPEVAMERIVDRQGADEASIFENLSSLRMASLAYKDAIQRLAKSHNQYTVMLVDEGMSSMDEMSIMIQNVYATYRNSSKYKDGE